MPPARSSDATPRRQFARPGVVAALIGLLFTVAVAYFLVDGKRVASEATAAGFMERLTQEFIRLETITRAYQGLFGASDEVTEEEFRAFSQGLLPSSSIVQQALYAQRVSHAQRAAFERWLREQPDALPELTHIGEDGVRRTAEERAEYYPVRYRARILDILEQSNLGIEVFGANQAGYRAVSRGQSFAGDPVSLHTGVTLYTISTPVTSGGRPITDPTGAMVLVVMPSLLLDQVELPPGLSAAVRTDSGALLWERIDPRDGSNSWPQRLFHWEYSSGLSTLGRDYTVTIRRSLMLGLSEWAVLLASLLIAIAGVITTVSLDRERTRVIEAESTSRAKSEFLAIMSHEIRTPLNGIMGMAELLTHARLPPTESKYADIIVNSGRSLLQIINDILDFSKIEAGRLQLEQIDVDLEKLVNEMAELYSYSSHLKGVAFSASLDPECPRVIKGDPTRLRQILLNLLSNAFKFTEHGEVVLRVSLQGHHDYQPVVCFSIRDTGIGMSEAVQQQLFAPFSQADKSTSRKYGGTGLGLTICRLLVNLMGSDIEVDSAAGKGSEFRFAVAFPPGDLTQKDGEADLTSLAGRRVLIVDDFETARLIFMEQARYLGMEARAASHCNEAWERLKSGEAFDFIITDFDMPDTDGISFIRALAQDPQTRDIPVFLMSASSNLGDQDLSGLHLAHAGTKPSSWQRLGTILCNHTAQLQRRHDREDLQLPLQLKVLVAEDNAINAMVVESMLRRLGQDCLVRENGALALRHYMEQPDNVDLILMDCEMPDMDGFETTRRIRDWEHRHQRTPVRIVALTAHALEGFEQRCREAGMDAFLPKPINLKMLRMTLQETRKD